VTERAEDPAPLKPFTNGMRSAVVGPLTRGLLGAPLLLFSASTATHFAWTIQPPLTAAVLGANYWVSAMLAILAARERFWAQGRVSISVALVFAPVTTAATLLHLSRFHLHSSGFTLFITWFWLVAYSLYPIQLGALFARQLRTPGADPPRTAPLPLWVRAVLAAHAVVLVPVGLTMFIAPGLARPLWPWSIPALSSRALSAWVLAFGVLGAHMVWENDFDRTKVALWCYPVLGTLHVVALARYGNAVRWSAPAAWFYVGVLSSTFLLGAYGYATVFTRRRTELALQ
jgi:hypothetical protein